MHLSISYEAYKSATCSLKLAYKIPQMPSTFPLCLFTYAGSLEKYFDVLHAIIFNITQNVPKDF